MPLVLSRAAPYLRIDSKKQTKILDRCFNRQIDWQSGRSDELGCLYVAKFLMLLLYLHNSVFIFSLYIDQTKTKNLTALSDAKHLLENCRQRTKRIILRRIAFVSVVIHGGVLAASHYAHTSRPFSKSQGRNQEYALCSFLLYRMPLLA